ncbi:hypothetical protein AMELA_G00106010 [Ameiurus melas]|uniref:NEDD4-binding protein 2-like 2 n=1 Tax=Ameiurus melas TaxID=219545 RepID=A0A7J6AUX9_AMEME|nr:hypothetical protein AMELA_G00106010 [Ameiurus melas]
MPNVTPPGSSPPPASGSVEDPQQHDRAETVSYGRTFPESGLPERREGVSDRPEVNRRPEQLNRGEEKTSGDDGRACGQSRNRDEVVKEIGIRSAAFIGPACRPRSAFEDELSEFYKELEQIDQPDAVDGSGEQASQFCTPAVKDKGSGQRYRPFPAARPRTDYRNTPQWRPQSYDMTCDWSNSHSYPNQWQLPPPSFCFYPTNPTPQPYSQPQTHQYFWLGPGVRLASSHSPAPREAFELWRYEEQNYQEVNQHERDDGPSLVLVLMRGVPGSGKSTLARHISTSGPSGLILSTDDYFYQKDGYHFEPTLLGAAHDWNQSRAKQAMLDGRTPVIIDNTNVQAWEMKPYVAVALETGYRVEFVEPDTSWKRDPVELEKRNHHGVSRETIANMLDRFELPVSVDIVMNSREPSHKRQENHSRPYRR